MQVAVTQEELLKLIDAALSGEEVVLAKGENPVAKIVPIRAGGFKLGVLREQLTGPVPDFFEPMSEEDLRLWEGGD